MLDESGNSKNWNASSIYFLDPHGNIFELIYRYEMDNNSSELFSSKSIQLINEVGLAHELPLNLAQTIHSNYGIGYFSKGPVSEEFVALGDENGLLVISGLKRNWYPTNQAARVAQLAAVIKNSGTIFKFSHSE